jgi:[protein-PII] uridylyltransferase
MTGDTSLRERRRLLLSRTDLQGAAFCQAYAAEADNWLSGVATRAVGDTNHHLALLAVGGYGRGSLCPYSDLDVVLVHRGHRDIKAVADAIWYPVWDEGVHLDHSVRRPAEVLSAAASDVRVALGLLDARLVWGDAKVADPLMADVRAAWRESLGTRYLPDLQGQMQERHRGVGDVAFLLEPDLKESHGGLRDVNVLRAISAYAPLLAEYADLASLEPASTLLTRVRVELHRSAGREQDRLLLQDQDQIASALAFDDADALMAAVSEAGRQIAWVSDDVWRRRRLWDPTPAPRRRRFGRGVEHAPAATPVPVGSDMVDVDGEIALLPGAPVSDDPSLAFRLAATAAELDRPIAKGSLYRLADRMPPPGDPWPPAVRESLVRLLAAGRPAVDKLESLDQHGLLVRIIPEWAAVRNKPQRNAYHTFTVDRHLLETAALASGLTDRVERADLLLIGALLHDIGKGFPGDHTDVGMVVAAEIAARMGLPPDDVATIVTMVRLHLLLPDTATRRDLDDPATARKVADDVGDRPTLDLLAVMVEADSLATGPSAWGSWKAGLVADLVERARLLLAGEPVAPPTPLINEDLEVVMDTVRTHGVPALSLSIEPPLVTVVAPDRSGLLAEVTGVLALHGLNVRSAVVASEHGVAVETFTVEPDRGRWPVAAKLSNDLAAAMDGTLDVDAQLDERAHTYRNAGRVRVAQLVSTQVTVDNNASATATVVEVRAEDIVGQLHRITRALVACHLDVTSAKVSTFGAAVVDAFYVRGPDGEKVTDGQVLARLDEVIRDRIGQIEAH